MTQTVEVKIVESRRFNGKTSTYDTREIEIPEDYEPVRRASYNTQSEVTSAFVEGKFPYHNVRMRSSRDGETTIYGGYLYSSENFHAILRSDGRGTITHYRTIETIRTYNGQIIVNSQCWSGGFAHCSPPRGDDNDGSLPLTLLNSRGFGKSIYDIVDVREKHDYGGYPKVAEFEDGTGVAVISDETSNNWQEEVVFKLTKKEMNELDDIENVAEYIKPDMVKGVEERKDVVRQGEWWFIPYPDKEFPKGRIIKALKQSRDSDGNIKSYRSMDEDLGNHVPRDKVLLDDGRVFVRGTVRHLQGDHEMINLEETWHKAVRERYKEVRVAEPRGGGRVD